MPRKMLKYFSIYFSVQSLICILCPEKMTTNWFITQSISTQSLYRTVVWRNRSSTSNIRCKIICALVDIRNSTLIDTVVVFFLIHRAVNFARIGAELSKSLLSAVFLIGEQFKDEFYATHKLINKTKSKFSLGDTSCLER